MIHLTNEWFQQESHDQILGELASKTEETERNNALIKELESQMANKDHSLEELGNERLQLRQSVQKTQDMLDECKQVTAHK